MLHFNARSSWLVRRVRRHARNSSPTGEPALRADDRNGATDEFMTPVWRALRTRTITSHVIAAKRLSPDPGQHFQTTVK